jgi:hypothetical protein
MAVQPRPKPKTELISRATRRELQEHFVGTTLRIIDRHFGDADIECDDDFTPTESGERRGRVQKYYATLDFSDWESVRKFLRVYGDVLSQLDEPTYPWHKEPTFNQKNFGRLANFLRKDGFEYKDGKIVPTGSLPAAAKLKEDALRVDAPYMAQQIDRIENQIEIDPRLAIGTSKELVETVCKTILTDLKVTFDRKWELSELIKATREQLKLVPDDVPDTAKACDTIRRLLGNLGSITQSLAELRNAYGTGHGQDGRAKGLSPRHARLAAGAACTLAKFLFETHQHQGD